eukprot:TRINITY_DN6631_c0_g1_i1.p1 TRINITY_DN6631_c0_g1~~TRINITY_DN6631_c0_g1_i1.p1  ORF type:complete len:776 (-),score=131.97 TRINITY_DN6631_c0_g1_i1:51-2378(-)
MISSDSKAFVDPYGFEYSPEHYEAETLAKLEQSTNEFLLLKKSRVEQWKEYIDTFGDLGIDALFDRKRDHVLSEMVANGVPDEYRKDFWLMCVGYNERRILGYYDDIVNQLKGIQPQSLYTQIATTTAKTTTSSNGFYASSPTTTPPPTTKQSFSFTLSSFSLHEIDQDLERTFPNHSLLRDETKKAKLQRVLGAFAVRNPTIGYCQSMNNLCFFLFLVFGDDEEKVFWVLVAIIEEWFPEYYTRNMIGSQVDQRVFSELIEESLVDLSTHLKSLGVLVPLITIEWFLCLYTTTLTAETALIVWDNFLFHGAHVVLEVGLALMYLYRNDLANCTCMADVVMEIERLNLFVDPSMLMKTAIFTVGRVRKSTVQTLRMKHWTDIKKESEESRERKELRNLSERTRFGVNKLQQLKAEFNLLSRDGGGITFLQFQQVLARVFPNWTNTRKLQNLHIKDKEHNTSNNRAQNNSNDENLHSDKNHINDSDENSIKNSNENSSNIDSEHESSPGKRLSRKLSSSSDQSTESESNFGVVQLFARIFDVFDEDGDKMLSFAELMMGLSILFQGSLDEKLRLIFRTFDQGNKGYLNKDEVKKIFYHVYDTFYKPILINTFGNDNNLNVSGGLFVDHKRSQLATFVDSVFEGSKKNSKSSNANILPDNDGKVYFEGFRKIVIVQPLILECFQPIPVITDNEEREFSHPLYAHASTPRKHARSVSIPNALHLVDEPTLSPTSSYKNPTHTSMKYETSYSQSKKASPSASMTDLHESELTRSSCLLM